MKFAVGDYIIFKSPTRFSYAKAKRKIIELDGFGRPLVRYAGWNGFIVKLDEIIEVIPS